MMRAISIWAVVLLSGCGDTTEDISEADIANRASAISRSADETVNKQIADIERSLAEEAAQDSANALTAASNAAESSP